MKHVHFFQLNIEAENTRTGTTQHYLNVLAECTPYDDLSVKPFVYVKLLAESSDFCNIKDFSKVYWNAVEIANNHFEAIFKSLRIAQARAILFSEGEATGNPILDRYTEAEKDLLIQETLS